MQIRLRFHRRYHGEMLELMRILELDEYAVLSALIDLYCTRGGDLPDDERFLAGVFTTSRGKFRRIRSALIDKEFLRSEAGRLTPITAERALHEGLRLIEDAARAGRASAEARRAKGEPAKPNDKDFNGLESTPVRPSLDESNHNKNMEGVGTKWSSRATAIGDCLRKSPDPYVRNSVDPFRIL